MSIVILHGEVTYGDKSAGTKWMWKDTKHCSNKWFCVVIKKEDDKLVIENPGSIRTGKKQMLRGGISDPRNKTLMKMFNMRR